VPITDAGASDRMRISLNTYERGDEMIFAKIIIGLLTAFIFYILWWNANWEDRRYKRRHGIVD
jgi:hypothetical protein